MIHLTLAVALMFQSATPPSISRAMVLPAETKPSYRAHSSPACSDWRSARAGKHEDSSLRAGIYRKWVLGYITGFNIVGPDQSGNLLATATRDEVYVAIDGFCQRNPANSVVDAMRPLAEAIISRRGTPATLQPSSQGKKHSTVDAPTTCREWVRDGDNNILRLAYITVLYGYITAYNQWGPGPLGDAIGADDLPLVEKTINGWCSEHPTDLLIGVVTPLINHVAAERAAGRLPPGGLRPENGFTRDVPAKH